MARLKPCPDTKRYLSANTWEEKPRLLLPRLTTKLPLLESLVMAKELVRYVDGKPKLQDGLIADEVLIVCERCPCTVQSALQCGRNNRKPYRGHPHEG